MQLRNRMVKSDYWTDTELMRILPIAGRMLYHGIWHLAEDSGCLEYDPTAFKVQLFPLDGDITVEDIEEWTQKLISMEKLIPYGKGDRYLYIKNFHKHQTLHSPAQPELPLPEWVEYVPNQKKRTSGGYIIYLGKMPADTESIPSEDGTVTVGNVRGNPTQTKGKPNGDRTESVRSPYGDPEVTNKNWNWKGKEKKKTTTTTARARTHTHTDGGAHAHARESERETLEVETENQNRGGGCRFNDLEDQDLKALYRLYEDIYGTCANPAHIQMLMEYIDEGMELGVVEKAMRRGRRGDNVYSYTEGILRRWSERSVETLSDVEKLDRERKAGGNGRSGDGHNVLPFYPPPEHEVEREDGG